MRVLNLVDEPAARAAAPFPTKGKEDAEGSEPLSPGAAG